MNQKTLLDEFALVALAGILAKFDYSPTDAAAEAYLYADAMMAERAGRIQAPEPGPQAELAEPEQRAFELRVQRYAHKMAGKRVTCTQVYQAVTECVARPQQTALLYVGQILRGLGFNRVRSGGKDYYQL